RDWRGGAGLPSANRRRPWASKLDVFAFIVLSWTAVLWGAPAPSSRPRRRASLMSAAAGAAARTKPAAHSAARKEKRADAPRPPADFAVFRVSGPVMPPP